jgi:non-ribosomal peptide synthetase component F/acyl carrier protein
MTFSSVSHQPEQPAMESPQVFSFPASFAQRRLWFLNQLTPGDVSYTVAGAVEIEGELDLNALEKSLQEIVRRHESLRTLFEGKQGECLQVIQPEMRLEIEVLDLRSLPKPERLPKAETLRVEKSTMPFDLQRGPLFRVSVLRLDDQLHWMLVTMHHIISDGWSIGILVRELADLYSAFSQDRPSPLQELPVQYVDYTAWQQEQLSGERLQELVEYWKRQLTGTISGLELMTDHPRSNAPGNRGAQYKVQIEEELTRAIRAFAQEHGATIYMVLLAAFQSLLFRYTGQEEVLVGSPIAGRSRKETQMLIGFFVNTLVMKAHFSKEMTFRQLIQQVKQTTLEAYAHQDLPFEKLVEELSPERNMGRTPFFQAMLVLQNAPMPELQLGSARLRTLDFDSETAKFEMTLALTESGNILKGTLEYATDLFDAATMTRLFQHFTFLLESLVHDPDRPISQAQLVDEEERSGLAEGWRSKVPRALTAHGSPVEFIAEHAADENKVALITAEKQTTYKELDQRAAQIAVQLKAGGVEPGTRVAVYANDSVQEAVAVLGVLKAGAVAVPIDLEQPLSRIDFILRDAEAGWAVTEQKFEEQARKANLQRIILDSEVPVPAQFEPGKFEPGKYDPENPALQIYQSGASGKPVGVVIPHRGLLPRTFSGDANTLPEDVVGIWPRAAFKESGILELLRCLCAGAAIVQLESGGTPRKWASAIRDQKVTVLYAHGMEIERLAREFATTLKNVRVIVCGDPGFDVERLAENLKPEIAARVYCAYGTHETCGWRSVYPLGQRARGIAEFLAAGTRLELLDSEMNPLPVGIAGEVMVGGEALALGYHNQPEQTQISFPSDEYSVDRNARVYRSGDQGWRRNDGMLQIIGRTDGRGWLAGIRVEAAEVEAALNECEGVKAAGVLARRNGVMALLVTDSGTAPEPGKLQQWLSEKIPQGMAPQSVHEVANIPCLANGSVDRVKLNAMAEQIEKARNANVPYAPPENEIQRKLVVILEKILGLERVGIHDDFFRLGGHSLLATQVVAQISHELGVELPLRRLFDSPTVAQLAQIVAQLSNPEMQAETIPQIKRIARVPVHRQTMAK